MNSVHQKYHNSFLTFQLVGSALFTKNAIIVDYHFTSLALLSRILILGAGASGADVILIMSGSLVIITIDYII